MTRIDKFNRLTINILFILSLEIKLIDSIGTADEIK